MADVKKDVKDQELDQTLEETLEAQSTKATSQEESPQESTPEEEKAVEEESSDMMKQLQTELEEYKSKYLRLNADFQNFRKRTEKEKADLYKYANEKLIVELLPLVDNMERALDHIDEENKSSIVDGLKMIHKGFMDTLDKNGVEPIDAVGEEFDPQIHNAVMMEESDEFDSNVVIEEFQKGYRLKEKVIRHSMVKVSQ